MHTFLERVARDGVDALKRGRLVGVGQVFHLGNALAASVDRG